MLSNSGERWLISITDMPEPRQSSSSSRMRSRTESGKALGPALKLWTRCREAAVALGDTIGGSSLWRPIRSRASCRDSTHAASPSEYHGALPLHFDCTNLQD